MNFTRREALFGGASLSALGMLASPMMAKAAGSWPSPLLVVITGEPGTISAARFKAAYRPFHRRGIPVTISVPAPAGYGEPGDVRTDLIRTLRALRDEDPALTEIAIDLGAVDAASPYFQLRQASEAQARFAFAVNLKKVQEFEATLTGLTATTTTPIRSGEDFAAMRASGIRSVIHLSGGEAKSDVQPADGGIWMTGNGLANIFGTEALSIALKGNSPPLYKALQRDLDAAVKTSNPLVLHIALDALAGMSHGDFSDYAAGLAEIIKTARDKENLRCLLPRVMYRQNRPDDARYVVLRVDDYRIDEIRRQRHEAFVSALVRRDIPVADGIIPVGSGILLEDDQAAHKYIGKLQESVAFEPALHGWKHTPNEFEGRTYADYLSDIGNGSVQMARVTGQAPRTFIPPNNVMDDSALDALAATGIPIFSAQKGNYRWFTGLDHRGLLHVSNTTGPEKSWQGDFPYFTAEEIVTQIGPDNDAVLMLHPNTMEQPEHLETALAAIDQLANEAGTTLTTFEGFRAAVMPTMPALDLIHSARAIATVPAAAREEASAVDEEAQLQRDAELAWRYFDWGADRFRGMAPATGWEENGKFEGYPFITMWDIGSLIQGTISAHRIGIIDQAGFETRMQRAVAFLGESFFDYKGNKLPENERSVGRQPPTRQGFDSADTGRMLIALSVLDAYTNGSFDLAKLVQKWDLAVTLPDGEMHDIKGREPESLHLNSYSSYTRQGYTAWNYDVREVIDETDLGRSMDAAMRFAEEVRRRGRIATEPHTTEEIELGASARTGIVLDLLSAAQIKRYEATGILTCVSEGPIDGDPFFTYQGFQLDEDGGHWVVDAAYPKKIKATERRGDAARLVSTKGCFLWAATRPGDYSKKLLSLVREKARIEGLGFSSGIYERTGRVAPLSDINTNGIILEAICFMLNGRVPLIKTTPELRPADARAGLAEPGLSAGLISPCGPEVVTR